MSKYKLKKQPPCILIVEDDRTHQRFVETMLEEMGFNATIATNGKIAVDLLKESHFDLVLMDCNMPVMDGYQAARIISDMRTDGVIGDIPVIALTSNQREGDPEKCFESGMDDYIAKSLWLPKWKPRIERIIRKWLAASSAGKENGAGMEIISAVTVAKAQALAGKQFGTLVSSYLTDAESHIERIRELAQSKKPAEESVLHAYTLISSSKQIGAVQIAHLASEIARHASVLGKNGDNSSPLLPQAMKLEALYRQTREALELAVKR